MIKADDLIRWVREHAVSPSLMHINGWIRGDDLLGIAEEVKNHEPFDYNPVVQNRQKK